MKPSLTHGLGAVLENLRFFTRLPLGESALAPNFGRIGWAAPLAGAIVGAFGAAAFLVSRKLGFPGTVAATIAVAAEVAIAGSLHEDGLADVFDGFGGGYDRETKLAIMRDSRIGVYGAIALFLVLLLRIEIIGAMSQPFPNFAAAAMVLAAAAARAAALAPLAWARPARTDGAGSSIGPLGHRDLFGVAAVLFLITSTFGFFWLGVVRAIFSCIVGATITWLFVASAKRQIGGQTGDVCGASAALAEVAVLLALIVGGREA